jgi:hypothetical protein
MGLSKRAGAAMTGTLGLVLLAVVLRDMYAD